VTEPYDQAFFWVEYFAGSSVSLVVVVEGRVADAEEESVSSGLGDVLLQELSRQEAVAEAEVEAAAVLSRSLGILVLN
jgi:hypothetical protein